MNATRNLLLAIRTGAFLAVAGVLFVAGRLEAQRVVMVHEEPRHRVVVDRGDVKLLDVQILPGDTTLDHTHDSPIMYTYISLGRGSSNGRVVVNLDYANEPYTHNVTNAGTTLFRIIALAHYGEGEAEVAASRPDGLRVEPQEENRWFRSYRLELAPGEETPVHRHRHDAVIVQVSEGRVEVTKENGFGAELAGEGDWTWRDPESPYVIRNPGSVPVTVVINEPRRGR